MSYATRLFKNEMNAEFADDDNNSCEDMTPLATVDEDLLSELCSSLDLAILRYCP